LGATEAVLLLTDHAAFDYRLIAGPAPLIVDTRGVFAPAPNVVRACFTDRPIYQGGIFGAGL
jgi:UDP-N-acetyl-D-mannosaminuronate dehydrogenase